MCAVVDTNESLSDTDRWPVNKTDKDWQVDKKWHETCLQSSLYSGDFWRAHSWGW